MTAAELKASILDRAVRGLLVPQDPSEGLREHLKLRDVISLTSGQDFPPSKYNSERLGIPYITGASNLDQGKVVVNRWTKEPSVIAHKDELLLVCKGSGVGKTAVMQIEEAHIARQIMALKPNSKITLSYLSLLIEALAPEFRKKMTGLIPGISRPVLLDAKILLPPLAEQKRIVAKIEELMPLVEEYGKAEAELTALNENFPTALRKSILQHAVEGRLTAAWRTSQTSQTSQTAADLLAQIAAEKKRLLAEGKIKKQKPLPPITEEEKPFPIPDSWEWVRLGEVIDTQLGKMLDTAKSSGIKYKYLANYNVQWNAFNLSEIRETLFREGEPEKFELKAGDILMCEGGEPGRCAIWKSLIPDVKFQKALHRLRPYRISSEFVVRYFEALTSTQSFRDILTGETIKHLPKEVLVNIPIPLPPLAEQKAIVARVEELLSLVDELKA